MTAFKDFDDVSSCLTLLGPAAAKRGGRRSRAAAARLKFFEMGHNVRQGSSKTCAC